MKITCQSCQSKYTIADDKVLGKVVKIRCKKCGATIFVNGNDGTTSTGTDADHEPLSRYRAESPPAEWTVNVADGDQRTMTDDEVVAAFRASTIGAETFFWKDGMPDWVPLREIGDLFRSCTAAPQASGSSQASAAPLAARGPSAWQEPPVATSNNGSGGFPAAPAARRAGGRAAGVDLFGGVAQAGGEADVLTSAPAKIPQAHEAQQKPTGARNESSVLFSLSAMTSKPSTDPPPRGEEASGLIDIRQLSAQIGIEEKKQSRVDDIMNLTAGGAFSPTLTAPALSAPVFDAYAPDSEGAGGLGQTAGRSKGVILLAIGASAFVIVAAVGGALVWMRGRQAADAEKETSAASSAAAEPAPAPSASVAMAVPPGPEPTAAGSASSNPSAVPSPDPGGKPPSAGTKTASNAPAAKDTSPSPAPVARAPAAPAVEAGPFNMGEAKARLGAAAASAAGCKKSNGPTGTGKVIVVFAPTGAAQSASVSGPPFEGTPTGSCVAARFRGVRVPAFSGSSFSVSKSFSIN
jgi:predicted Zn finger-like uncharacterized protein